MFWKSVAELLMEETDRMVYVSDKDTYQLHYMNASAKRTVGLAQEDESYRDKTCYQLLYGRETPCEFCEKDHVNAERFYRWDHYNDYLGEHFHTRSKLIRLQDKEYRLDVTDVVTEEREKQLAMQQKMREERTLLECVRVLSDEGRAGQAMDLLLEIIGNYYDADRTYLFELDSVQQVCNNTYEWAAPGVTREINRLQGVPLEYIAPWLEMFRQVGRFHLSDVDADRNQHPDAYELLKVQNIQSLIAVPLWSGDKMVGFFGVDNPRRYLSEDGLLPSITYFIQNSLDRDRNRRLLERLSYEDSLTGLHNRNRFDRVVEAISKVPPVSLGVVYMDLNGLKEANDTFGHQEGDALLRRTASVARQVFPGTTYRIGGDEFVALLPGLAQSDMDMIRTELQLQLAKAGICMSCGFSWRDKCVNVREQLLQAEQHMYREKAAAKAR